MSNSKCYSCGYEWKTGTNGEHSCVSSLTSIINRVADELNLPTENGNRVHDLQLWLDSPKMETYSQGIAALKLLKRIRWHSQRQSLPREWLQAADEVLGTFGNAVFTHKEINSET